MADKFDRNAGLFVKIFFEWKNHQQLVEIAAKSPHSMLPPSPNLRGYVIDCRKTQSFQLSRKPHVEVGIIDENYQVRFSLNRGVAKPVESLHIRRNPVRNSSAPTILNVAISLTISTPAARISAPPEPKNSN